jgi:hypothetical protein
LTGNSKNELEIVEGGFYGREKEVEMVSAIGFEIENDVAALALSLVRSLGVRLGARVVTALDVPQTSQTAFGLGRQLPTPGIIRPNESVLFVARTNIRVEVSLFED